MERSVQLNSMGSSPYHILTMTGLAISTIITISRPYNV